MSVPHQNISCSKCSDSFCIFPDDETCYARFQVPHPKLCPDCREQRRLSHINQLHLFRRVCEGTGQSLITHFAPESAYRVCHQQYWFSDQVDNTKHGRPFDFTRPFFDQFYDLSQEVMHPALITDYLHNENSEYTNYVGRLKDCYLLFDSDESRDCYYGYTINGCRNTVDCYRVKNLELCYQVIDSRNCYQCSFLEHCESCSDSAFLNNCIGCKHCICCSNLRQKEYHIFNKPVTKDHYMAFAQRLKSRQGITQLQKEHRAFCLPFPQKFLRGFQNENVSGNYLVNCKNVFHGFDCLDLWDGRYCFQTFMKTKNVMDVDQCGEGELLYECTNLGYNAYHVRFSLQSLEQLTDLTYCSTCFTGCANLFGCIGLKRTKHCILNKPYTVTEYEQLVPRIIAHMKETGEWGEFFPTQLSSYPYNCTLAQLFYPLTKSDALRQGFAWRDDDARDPLAGQYRMPETIQEVGDEVLREILVCGSCGGNYKIASQELRYYRTHELPLPSWCFHCRHLERFQARLPRQLWSRKCDNCQLEIETAYAPNRPEQVYCEPCYLNSLE